jgi:uncharacterized YigZ family protein
MDVGTGPGTTVYHVPAATAETEIEIKRSRFLCLVERVESEEAARAVIARRRRLFHDARHTCSAFLLGPSRTVARSNDDGEPAGTAGAPMLEALSRHHGAPDLSDTVAVVTRWFGGVLLGAGGLTRAYSEAVASTLADTPLVERRLMRLSVVTLDYASAGRVEGMIRAAGIAVTEASSTATGIELTLAVAASEPPQILADRLAQLTGGAAVPGELGTEWVDLPRARS